jgi:hypothetical protein
VLQDQYLELVGAFGEGVDNVIWDKYASTSQGVWELGFKTTGARELHQELSKVGVAMEQPYDYSRPINLDGRDLSVDFVVCYVAKTLSLPTRAFICEHITPELIWRSEWARHANGCRRILRIDVAASDPSQAAAHYSHFVEGYRRDTGPNATSIFTSNTEIRVVPEENCEHAPGRTIWLEVNDLAAARSLLKSAGLALSESSDHQLTIPTGYDSGSTLIFTSEKSRRA